MIRNTTYQGRAVIVAVMMVVSVVAVSATFAGSAVAAVDSAQRSISDQAPAPGETVEVTVDVQLDSEGFPEVAEEITPAPGTDNLTVVSDDGATLSTTSSDEVTASWGSTDSVTLVYEVTIPENASDGDTYTISGTANDQEITGDSEITVTENPIDSAQRTISDQAPAPGETVNVTVDVQLNGNGDPAVSDTLSPAPGALAITDSDGASGSSISSDRVDASWNGTNAVSLVYEVTIPENASDGDTFSFSGTANDRADDSQGDQTITGDSEITVSEGPIDSAQRSISNQAPAPGDTVSVTVDVQLDSSGDPAVSETVSPAPGGLSVTDDDGASSSSTTSDGVNASWDGTGSVSLVYEVTIPESASNGETFTLSGTVNDRSVSGEGEQTITGDSEITVSEGPVKSAVRSISDTTPEPGETVQVTVDVQLKSIGQPELSDKTSPAPGSSNLAVVSDDGATLSTVSSDEVVASWGSTDAVTLVYELTIPESASDGDTFTLSGNASDASADGDIKLPISGDSKITVTDNPVQSAQRIIDDTEPAPGETVNVTVDVQFDSVTDPSVTETISPPPGALAITDNDGASGSSISSDGITASWSGTDAVTLAYEVTIPDDASDQDTFSISGSVSGETISGDSEITVSASPVDQYRNEQGVVTPQGLLDAAADFRNGEIAPSTLLDVAATFRADN